MKSAAVAPILGESACIQALRRQITRVAPLDGPVHVRGETGSGKELVARACHDASRRPDGPYIAVNCGAIPRELVESELFGATAGAFTGARARDGHFARAHGGTLFLDEVGELPRAAQAALLRVLETGEVTPLGADRTRRVDVRVVTATHRDIAVMVEAGEFRRDLLHRIAPLVLEVPPLRARVEDIARLAEHFLGGTGLRVNPAGLRVLHRHPWTGNVRELRNVLLRARAAHALDDDADIETLEPRHLGLTHPRPESDSVPASTTSVRSLQPLREVITAYSRAAVDAHQGNLRAAARALQVSPTTLYRHLHRVDATEGARG